MRRTKLLSKPIAYTLFALIGFLFIFCFLTGWELAAKGNICWTAAHTLLIVGGSLLLGAALGILICLLFYKCAEKASYVPYLQPKREAFIPNEPLPKRIRKWLIGKSDNQNAWKAFICSILLNFFAWIPAFLAYYPAICAYDMPIQLEQILSGSYIDHHPIFHTLLIKGFMELGKNLFGNINAGIGCYAIVQMLVLSASFAFGMSCLHRRGIKRILLIIVQILCMLYPFHGYMSISVTKDTLFSAFFIVTLSALSELTEENSIYAPVFFTAGTGMILFRNNGKYAFLVLLVFLFGAFLFDKDRRLFRGKVFLLAAGAFLAGNLLLYGVFKMTGAEQGDKREMLSIPIQQLARTMVYHGGIGLTAADDGAMPARDKALINDFILDEAYRDYRPDFTDPVKSHTNTYVVRYRAKDFLTTYIGLFLQFPGDYLNAALAVDAGYLYPNDVSHARINAQEGQAAGGGYVQTRWDEGRLREAGIYRDSKWPGLWNYMEKWADDNAYLRIPLLKYLFVPGVWIWLYLLLAGWLLINRKFARCIPLTLVFGYFLTLFLGPTVQLRYLYPVMVAFPFVLGTGLLPEKGREE